MKNFTVEKFSLARPQIAVDVLACTEARAGRDDDRGAFLLGWDQHGRRWSVLIDDELIEQLATLVAARKAAA